MIGMIYERCHTRELAQYGGLARLLPMFSVFFMILTLASVGLPTTSGFAGEFMVLMGSFDAAWPLFEQGRSAPLLLAASAVLGVVLGAWYMLRFAKAFLFGAPHAPHAPLKDLCRREQLVLAALVLAIFAIGLYPEPLLRKTEVAAREYQAFLTGAATQETRP
jgi:NADH-quinone oxidoreductase subunit M